MIVEALLSILVVLVAAGLAVAFRSAGTLGKIDERSTINAANIKGFRTDLDNHAREEVEVVRREVAPLHENVALLNRKFEAFSDERRKDVEDLKSLISEE